MAALSIRNNVKKKRKKQLLCKIRLFPICIISPLVSLVKKQRCLLYDDSSIISRILESNTFEKHRNLKGAVRKRLPPLPFVSFTFLWSLVCKLEASYDNIV